MKLRRFAVTVAAGAMLVGGGFAAPSSPAFATSSKQIEADAGSAKQKCKPRTVIKNGKRVPRPGCGQVVKPSLR